MANRFLETNYYKSPFVRSLKGSLKLLYSFIICDCTGAGIWSLDLEAASLYTGFEITMEEFDTFFVKKNKAIELGRGKYFFPDFIEHQYPKGLSNSNPAHKNVISDLHKLKLINEKNEVIKGALKGLISPIGNEYGNGNVFNSMPIFKDFNGLPDIKIGAAKELVRITAQKDLSDKEIKDIWEVFKIQNLTGKKYYQDEDAVYSHFINWVKKQDFKKIESQIQQGLPKNLKKLN